MASYFFKRKGELRGLALDNQDNIYALESFSNSCGSPSSPCTKPFRPGIEKFDPGGHLLSEFDENEGEGRFASGGGIAVDAGGNIYVVDYAGALLLKYDSQGHVVFGIQTDYSPYGLAVDDQGKIYVNTSRTSEVYKLT